MMIIDAVIIAVGALVVVIAGAPFVSRLVAPYSDQFDVETGLDKGGRMIGWAERLLIYVFVLADAPTAIGFLVTAKSIFRFGEVTGKEQRRLAEYIIIGTLVSFAYAVTLSYVVRWLINVL